MFSTPDNRMIIDYTVCTFEFNSSVYLEAGATINIRGLYSLKIVSKNGDVQIMTDLTLKDDKLGGFVLKSLQGRNEGEW